VKFTCNRDTLSDALSNAARALTSRTSISGIRWTVSNGWLTLEGRESDLSIASSLQVTGSEGRFSTPAGLTADLIKSMPNELIEVVVEEQSVSFRSGRAEASLALLTEFDIPPIESPAVRPVSVNGLELAGAIKQVAVAASKDDGRDLVYSGILFTTSDEGLRLVATDGVRLALRDITGLGGIMGGEHRDVVVPTRAVRELERILASDETGEAGLEVSIGTKQAVFSMSNTRLATRLIDEPFRDYRRLLDVQYSKVLLVDKLALSGAVRRLRRMAREARSSAAITMDLNDQICEMSVKIPQVGQFHEVLDVNFSDLEFSISFDPDLLADGIDGIQSDVARLEFVEANRAACLSNSDDRSYLYLVMPIVRRN
jgi:DNA polymerase-3 subunit beta